MQWADFLANEAATHSLSPEQTAAFVERLKTENSGKSEVQVANELNISAAALKKRMTEVYDKFAQSYPELANSESRGKLEKLRACLTAKYNGGQDVRPTILETPPLSTSNQTTFSKVITLSVENSRSIITKEDLLNNIRIKPQTPGAMEIFNLDDAPPSPNDGWSWQDINFPLYNSRESLEELADSIYSAHNRIVPRVVQSTFRASNGRLYRPILYRRELTDDSEQFTVIFVEQISEGWVDNAPSVKLATLLTASILGARLQWGVCNRYLGQLDHLQQRDLDAIRSVLKQVKTSFTYIDEDARIRSQGEAPGQRNEDRLRDSFDSEDEKQIITNNMREQERHKQALRTADRQDNVDEVRVALTELAHLNPIVTAMVARRYSQLLNENSS